MVDREESVCLLWQISQRDARWSRYMWTGYRAESHIWQNLALENIEKIFGFCEQKTCLINHHRTWRIPKINVYDVWQCFILFLFWAFGLREDVRLNQRAKVRTIIVFGVWGEMGWIEEWSGGKSKRQVCRFFISWKSKKMRPAVSQSWTLGHCSWVPWVKAYIIKQFIFFY